MFIECWPRLGQTMNIYTLIYQSVATTKLLLQIFSYGQQQTLESSVCVCDNLSYNTSHKSLDFMAYQILPKSCLHISFCVK